MRRRRKARQGARSIAGIDNAVTMAVMFGSPKFTDSEQGVIRDATC